jgi:hypothetical protein
LTHLPPQRIYANQTHAPPCAPSRKPQKHRKALLDSGANASAVGQVSDVTNPHSDDRKIKQLVGMVGPVTRGNLSFVLEGDKSSEPVTLTNVAVVEGLEMNIVSMGKLIEQLECMHGKDVHITLRGDGGEIWDNGRCYPVDKVDGVYVISYDKLETMKACREDKDIETIKTGQEDSDVDLIHTDPDSKSDLIEDQEKEMEEIDVKPHTGGDQPGVDDTEELCDTLDSKDLREMILKDDAPALLDYIHSISHWKIGTIKESIHRGDLALPSELMKRVMKIDTIRCPHCDEWGKLKKHPKNQPVTQPHNIPLKNQYTADLKGSVYQPDYKGNRVLGVVVAGNGFINITVTKSKDASELEKEYRKNLRVWEVLSGQTMLSHASDRGTEYTGNDDHPMVKLFDERGVFQIVGPRDDSKGRREKAIDSVSTLTSVLMSASGAPPKMWSEAAHGAVDILNAQPSQSKAGQGDDEDGAHDGRSHFEMSTGRKPDLDKQKKFGCNALVNVPRSRRKKGQRRNEWMVHLRGAPRGGLGWRFYNPRTERIIHSRSARFYQHLMYWKDGFPDTGQYGFLPPTQDEAITEPVVPKLLEDLTQPSHDRSQLRVSPAALERVEDVGEDGAVDMGGYEEVEEVGNDEIIVEGRQPRERKQTERFQPEDHRERWEKWEQVHSAQQKVLTDVQHWIKALKTSDNPAPLMPDPLTRDSNGLWKRKDVLQYMLQHPFRPQHQLEDARQSPFAVEFEAGFKKEIGSFVSTDSMDKVSREEVKRRGKTLIGCKFILTIKGSSAETHILPDQWKVRLVALGYMQKWGEYGDTFASTPTLTSGKLLAVAALKNQWEVHTVDVKTAFLLSRAEKGKEIYMKPPRGYYDDDSVWMIKSGIYGSKPAANMWQAEAMGFCKEHGFVQTHGDPCVFVKRDKLKKVIGIVAVHVDDFSIAAVKWLIDVFKTAMGKKWNIKDFGQMERHLSVNYAWSADRRSVELDQIDYNRDCREKYYHLDSREEDIPMVVRLTHPDPNVPMTKEEKHFMSDKDYRSAVSSVGWLARGTRPDIKQAHQQLAQHMNDPRKEHWDAMTHLFRYLKKTENHVQRFTLDADGVMYGATDSDHAAAESKRRRSTTGQVFLICGGAVSCKCKQQPATAESSCEAELVALASGAREAIWLRRFLVELGIETVDSPPMRIQIDNNGARQIAEKRMLSERTKHLDVRYFSVRDNIEDKDIVLERVDSKNNVSDIFTKPLTRVPFEKFRTGLGVVPKTLQRHERVGTLRV